MYNRGKKRIDYILISATLQDSVEWSSILPYCSIFSGDHRPCFLDLNADLLFAGPTSPLAPPRLSAHSTTIRPKKDFAIQNETSWTIGIS
jgi:hypothetical protein